MSVGHLRLAHHNPEPTTGYNPDFSSRPRSLKVQAAFDADMRAQCEDAFEKSESELSSRRTDYLDYLISTSLSDRDSISNQKLAEHIKHYGNALLKAGNMAWRYTTALVDEYPAMSRSEIAAHAMASIIGQETAERLYATEATFNRYYNPSGPTPLYFLLGELRFADDSYDAAITHYTRGQRSLYLGDFGTYATEADPAHTSSVGVVMTNTFVHHLNSVLGIEADAIDEAAAAR